MTFCSKLCPCDGASKLPREGVTCNQDGRAIKCRPAQTDVDDMVSLECWTLKGNACLGADKLAVSAHRFESGCIGAARFAAVPGQAISGAERLQLRPDLLASNAIATFMPWAQFFIQHHLLLHTRARTHTRTCTRKRLALIYGVPSALEHGPVARIAPHREIHHMVVSSDLIVEDYRPRPKPARAIASGAEVSRYMP